MKKKKFIVRVKEISHYEQEVEAKNASEAKEIAIFEINDGMGNCGDIEYKTKIIYNKKGE